MHGGRGRPLRERGKLSTVKSVYFVYSVVLNSTGMELTTDWVLLISNNVILETCTMQLK